MKKECRLSGYDYDKIVMDALLSIRCRKSWIHLNDFNFFSVNGKGIVVTFNKGDNGLVTIFDGDGYPLYCGYPQYSKIAAPWGGLGRIQLSKEDRGKIEKAIGNDVVPNCVESVIMRYLEKR